MTPPGVTRRRFVTMLGAVGLTAVASACSRLVSGSTTTTSSVPPISTGAPTTTAATTSPAGAPSVTTTAASPPQTTTTTVEAATVTVIGRDGWAARPIDGELTAHTLERITVHHTAVPLDRNADAPAHIRGHQDYHQVELGWPDLAYHFMVDAAGNIYEGRPYDTVGDTATSYDPTGHLLVCCEGDFNTQPLPDAQRSGLVAIMAWGVAELGLDPATITGHRDHAATSCPGDPVAALIADGTLAQRVERRARNRPATLDLVTGDAAVAMVAEIESG